MKKLVDVNDTVYALTKTKLKTVKGDSLFWVNLKDIKEALVSIRYTTVQLWHGKHGPGHYIKVEIGINEKGNGYIGCRGFSKKTFALIVRAAKAVK